MHKERKFIRSQTAFVHLEERLRIRALISGVTAKARFGSRVIAYIEGVSSLANR